MVGMNIVCMCCVIVSWYNGGGVKRLGVDVVWFGGDDGWWGV